MIQQTHQLEVLERSALQQISQVLQVPLVALITWYPGQATGQIRNAIITNDRFGINMDWEIPISTDALLGWTLESDALLPLTIEDIPFDTRQWLSGMGIGQVLTMALRTAPEHEPTGIVLVADGGDRRWADRYLSAFGTLVSQLAWSRRYLNLSHTLSIQREELERLNWYKHRRLEELYRSLTSSLQRLNQLDNPKDPLFITRQQQALKQLTESIGTLPQLIQEELWRTRTFTQTIPLVTLLKRALERVDALIKQRQLWSQVHNETNLTISGDVVKMELVIYELLLIACERSQSGNRIDIWCRQIDNRWLEISITDNGIVEPRLFQELETGRILDVLAPSLLDHPPGLHLMICQTLMKQIGGDLNFYKLEDNRILSRLVLPLVNTSRSGITKPQ
jgi:signal transduction histidine kinase